MLLGSHLADSLAAAGDRWWSIDQGIGKLVAGGFGIKRDAFRNIPFRLRTEIQVMVQQELLAQVALEHHVDTVSDVQRQVSMWRSALLAGAVRDSLHRSVVVSDSELNAYLSVRDTALVPQVQIRELRTRTLEEMQAALADLEHGESFIDVIRKRSIDATARSHDGVTEFFSVTSRVPLGSAAAAMSVGERYGPVLVPGGVSYFELLAKRTATATKDSSLAARYANARQELLAMKQRRILTLHIAGLGKSVGFDVYSDRVKMLEVSTAPMMTFRVLGFGGRIPAVPFVEPQLDWLNVESPQPVILP
jgi:hypothetical protein